MIGVFCWAEALAFGFSPHPPAGKRRHRRCSAQEALYPAGAGGANRSVKRCAAGKAGRFSHRGIDPGFIHPGGGNPLPDTEGFASSSHSQNCRGAYLIRRRLCEGDSPVHSDDQFSTWSFGEVWPFPLAPGGRGVLRSNGVRGPPGAPRFTIPLGHVPLPRRERTRLLLGVNSAPGDATPLGQNSAPGHA